MTRNEALIILSLTGKVTKADIKLAYKRKIKQFHPDVNAAGLEMTKIINAAYEMVKNLENATVEDDETITDYPEELSEAINAIISIIDLHIEVCGLWVWVNGKTQEHKDILKSSGFKWASKKKMWYFRPAQAAGKNRSGKTWSMSKIRDSYGSDKTERKTKHIAAA